MKTSLFLIAASFLFLTNGFLKRKKRVLTFRERSQLKIVSLLIVDQYMKKSEGKRKTPYYVLKLLLLLKWLRIITSPFSYSSTKTIIF